LEQRGDEGSNGGYAEERELKGGVEELAGVHKR